MENFATVEDVMNLYGPLNADQLSKVEQLLTYTSSYFRTLAKEYGRNLNQEVIDDEVQIIPINTILKNISDRITTHSLVQIIPINTILKNNTRLLYVTPLSSNNTN